MPSASAIEVQKANNRARAARDRERRAREEAKLEKRRARTQAREAATQTKRIGVRITSTVVGTGTFYAGCFVGGFYMNGGKPIMEGRALTWGHVGGIVGLLGKGVGAFLEDTWWEVPIEAASNFLIGLGGADIAAWGALKRAQRDANNKNKNKNK